MIRSFKWIQSRTNIGGAILMLAPICWIYGGTLFADTPPSVQSAVHPVTRAVARPSAVHRILDLHTADGALVAHGDLRTVTANGRVESRRVFRFANSELDETVTYRQDGGFAMVSYRLMQRGPVFAEDVEVSMSGTGAYVVTTTSRDDGKELAYVGTAGAAPGAYNGVVISLAKESPSGTGETVRIVGFAPMLTLITTLRGDAPTGERVWIATDQTPAFVRFQDPMYAGPVWLANLASPNWTAPAIVR